MGTLEEILDLKSRIELMARRDPEFCVFGARSRNGLGHNYRFLPTLNERQIAAFERRHEIELPEDYRLYLTHVADGGVGPDCGLKTLAEASEGVITPNLPFPWMEKTTLAGADVHAFWERQPGALWLCNHGDQNTSLLVVNGPTRGTMWKNIPWTTEEFLLPYEQSFSVWYRAWVEMILRFLENEPSLAKVQVGMTLAQVVEILGPPLDTRPLPPSPRKNVSFTDVAADIVVDEHDVVVMISRTW